MLLNVLLTRYAWLITNVPQILHSHYRWKTWFEGLTPLNVMDLRMNITEIRHSRYMIEDEFDNYAPESEEFQGLCEIHYRLVELSFRLTS